MIEPVIVKELALLAALAVAAGGVSLKVFKVLREVGRLLNGIRRLAND